VGEGRGFGLAFAADQHGYPGPMHVLELKDRLRLTGDQERAMHRLMDAMFAESRPAAARLLATEQRLRGLFAAGVANEAATASTSAFQRVAWRALSPFQKETGAKAPRTTPRTIELLT
jgi:hypothetical protein